MKNILNLAGHSKHPVQRYGYSNDTSPMLTHFVKETMEANIAAISITKGFKDFPIHLHVGNRCYG